MDTLTKQEYDILVNQIIKNDKNYEILSNFQNKDKLVEFKTMFLSNVKKSTLLASILPSILFLVISLISFCLLFINDNNSNLGVSLNNPNLRYAIIFFSSFFLVISLILLVRRFIFKIRVINIKRYNKYGYMQLSNKKYKEIIFKIDESLNKY